jgi:hypothetical protein
MQFTCSTPTGGNYHVGAYTQIMSGNASYKVYEYRYGERELLQILVSQKMPLTTKEMVLITKMSTQQC